MTYKNNKRRQVRKSSTPDIALPSIANKDWHQIHRILCVDESLNDSGAAFFVDGVYSPVLNENNVDIGYCITMKKTLSQQEKIIKYENWIYDMIRTLNPDIVIGENHPFARGSQKTSIATLEVMAGIRYITMLVCGKNNVPYVEFSTNHVKTIMCGGASATKDMIQLVLQGCGYTLPVYNTPKALVNGNVCDAIAMGEVICRMQKQELLRREHIPLAGEGRPQTKHRRNI